MIEALAGFYSCIFLDIEFLLFDLNYNEIFNTFVTFKLA